MPGTAQRYTESSALKPSSKFSVETLDLSSASSRSAALSRVLICTRVVCRPSQAQRWMFHPSATPEQQGCRAPVTTVLVNTLLHIYRYLTPRRHCLRTFQFCRRLEPTYATTQDTLKGKVTNGVIPNAESTLARTVHKQVRRLFTKSLNTTKQKVKKIDKIIKDKHNIITSTLTLKFQKLFIARLTTLACERFNSRAARRLFVKWRQRCNDIEAREQDISRSFANKPFNVCIAF